MNIKVKAGLIVAGIVAGSLAGSLLLKLVSPYITLAMVSNGLMIASILILLYTAYDIIVTKLTYDQKLKAMVDQKNK